MNRAKKPQSGKQPRIFGIPEPLWLQKVDIPNWLILVLGVVFLARIPSFLEPYHYLDEMIYVSIGEALRSGLSLYRDVFDHKPPLIYWISTLIGNLFWLRVFFSVWAMANIILFFKISKILFGKNKHSTVAAVTAFAVLTTLPLWEGLTTNAEIFMMTPVLLAFYVILRKKSSKTKAFFVSGALFAIAFLFKVPAVFDMLAFVVFWLLIYKKKEVHRRIKDAVVMGFGFLVPVILTFIYFFSKNSLTDFLYSVFFVNKDYINLWQAGSFYQKIEFRSFVLILSLSFLFYFRRKLSKTFIFACVWIIFTLFAATFSGRPYSHYLLQTSGAISLLIGILLTFNTLEQSLSVIPLLLVLATINLYGFWYYPTLSYYENFVLYATGKISNQQYFSYFSDRLGSVYKVSEYIELFSKVDDKIFVWGNEPSIYALSKRAPSVKYLTDFHANDFSSSEKVFRQADQEKSELIILMKKEGVPENFYKDISKNYMLVQSVGEVEIFKRLGK